MWVKICGIRDLPTAAAVAALGPDAIGLNFYAKSPRAVHVEVAAEIVRNLPETVEPVGVFVNHTVDEIFTICDRVGLETAQLHGDESPQILSELQQTRPSLKIIRAHRQGPEGLEELTQYLAQCRQLGVKLSACLVDARADGVYGGSGKTVHWASIAPDRRHADWPPLVLAGGLNAQNVAMAISVVEPWGVDVASGVESAPGVKNLDAVKAFIDWARELS